MSEAPDLPRIELLLREAVARARELGWTIKPHMTVDRASSCCCPLGALLIARGLGLSFNVNSDIVSVLGDPAFDPRTFAIGFDCPEVEYESEEAKLGARLRREWVTT